MSLVCIKSSTIRSIHTCMYALHANIWEDSKTNKTVKKQDTRGRHVIISLQVKYGLYLAYIIREEVFDGISWNSTSDGWISTLNSMVLTAADIATFSSEFFRVGWIRSSQINSRWVTRFMFFWAEDIVDRNLQKRKMTQTKQKNIFLSAHVAATQLKFLENIPNLSHLSCLSDFISKYWKKHQNSWQIHPIPVRHAGQIMLFHRCVKEATGSGVPSISRLISSHGKRILVHNLGWVHQLE